MVPWMESITYYTVQFSIQWTFHSSIICYKMCIRTYEWRIHTVLLNREKAEQMYLTEITRTHENNYYRNTLFCNNSILWHLSKYSTNNIARNDWNALYWSNSFVCIGHANITIKAIYSQSKDSIPLRPLFSHSLSLYPHIVKQIHWMHWLEL